MAVERELEWLELELDWLELEWDPRAHEKVRCLCFFFFVFLFVLFEEGLSNKTFLWGREAKSEHCP